MRLQNELGQVKVAILQNGGNPLKHNWFQSNCSGFSGETNLHRTYIETQGKIVK
jgi:hypothetical protein